MPSGTFLLRFAGNVGLTSPLYSKIALLPSVDAQGKQPSIFCNVIRKIIEHFFITFYKDTHLLSGRH